MPRAPKERKGRKGILHSLVLPFFQPLKFLQSQLQSRSCAPTALPVKTPILLTALALLTVSSSTVQAQGPLANPGPPGPTQKSLQQIWDKIDAQQVQLAQLKAQNQALSAMLATSSSINLAWNLRTLDTNSASYSSLAFGPDGLPAIAYAGSASGRGALNFARFTGSSWIISTIDTAGVPPDECGNGVSLAFDHDGKPAICYNKLSNVLFGGIYRGTMSLKLARFDGSAWVLATVATFNSGNELTDGPAALGFGPDGEPAIAFMLPGAGIRYAKLNGGSWDISVVDSSGAGACLAFSPQGSPTIAYCGAGGAMLASLNGSEWVISTVDASCRSAPSLAFGTDGLPAVAYMKGGLPGEDGLTLARRFGGEWAKSLVDTTTVSGSAIGRPSLAFGADGQPIVAYARTAGLGRGTLNFARFDGTAWKLTSMAGGGSDIGAAIFSLAVGPDGQPMCSYWEPPSTPSPSQLRLAWKGAFWPVR